MTDIIVCEFVRTESLYIVFVNFWDYIKWHVSTTSLNMDLHKQQSVAAHCQQLLSFKVYNWPLTVI